MIQFALGAVSGVAPGLRQRIQTRLIRTGYALVNNVVDEQADLVFMNFGYATVDQQGAIALGPDDQNNKYAIGLYHRVAGAVDLRGGDVLEVGSGRGGGSSFLMRYLKPRSVTGVDLAASAVKFCRRRHRIDGLEFRQGSAEQLPFDSESFDAVVNIESSHCYPSFVRFMDEVWRVLRPGGHLLFADLRRAEQMGELRGQVGRLFTIVEDECITANVCRALELYSETRNQLIDRSTPRLLRTPMRNFAAVKGTPAYMALQRRELDYWRFVLRKEV